MDDGYTPLYIASRRGHTEIVAALLAAGANVEDVVVCTEQAATVYLTASSAVAYM